MPPQRQKKVPPRKGLPPCPVQPVTVWIPAWRYPSGCALAGKQEESGVKLLWGTANCFTNPRYGAGAATNPDPEVFSWAATQVVTAMEATHKLGGENYVLWGGREGYETLLNTDLRQEREQLGRFMQMV